MQTERRSAPLELRAIGRKLEGYAARFASPAVIGGKAGFTETIERGAFAGSLADDIVCLGDHDPARLLGRTRNGTLRLWEDDKGLGFECQVANTTVGNDTLELVRSGSAGGMSFGFEVPDGGDDWRGKSRTLRKITLREISVVSSWPAYPDTVVFARGHLKGKPLNALLFARRYMETVR